MTDTALLVIDVQQSFLTPGRWERRWNVHFERNVARLIAAARDRGAPVFFIMHSDGDSDAFLMTSPLYRLMDFIERQPEEPLLHKTTRNSFTSTDLLRLLIAANVRRLIVCGIQTEQCCETTARLAADYGFEVLFVTEATQTFPIGHATDADAPELAAADVVERTEYALRGRFARIVTVDDVVEALGVLQPQ